MTGSSRRRLWACVALSMLLHALVLAVYRGRVPARAAESTRTPSIEVTLRAPRYEAEPARDARPVRRSARARDTPPAVPAPGSERAQAPSAAGDELSTPRVDLEAARRIARESARAMRKTPVHTALVPSVPEPETPLGRAIAKAANPDCRTAYAGAGLFAILFLVKDGITDDGCNW